MLSNEQCIEIAEKDEKFSLGKGVIEEIWEEKYTQKISAELRHG